MPEILLNIGGFKFMVNDAAFTQLRRTVTYPFAKQALIANYPDFQATGESEETIELAGKLVMKPQKTLADLEIMAEKKEAQRMTSGTGENMGKFLINSITYDRSMLNPDGRHKLQTFTIRLTRYRKGEKKGGKK